MTELPNEVPQMPVRRTKAVGVGWICLAVGMFFMFWSLAAFFLYGPLFLAAFILSIVGMTQERIAAGVILLVVVIAVPSTTWLGLTAYRVGNAFEEIEQEKLKALSGIELEGVTTRVDDYWMYCEGTIRNTGTETATFVKVGVEWTADDGTILDTDFTYAVSSEGLRLGAARKFEIMTKADARMTKYRCYIITD